MLKFLNKKATSGWEKLGNIALAYIIAVVWTIGIVKFYNWLFAVEQIPISFSIFNQFQFAVYKHPFLIGLFFACLIAPIFEELMMRHFPLQIIKATGKKELLLPTILFTSTIFGLLHDGAPSILMQGVFGFLVSIMYIKNGYSYWSAVLLHFLWNISLICGILSI